MKYDSWEIHKSNIIYNYLIFTLLFNYALQKTFMITAYFILNNIMHSIMLHKISYDTVYTVYVYHIAWNLAIFLKLKVVFEE